MSKTLSLLSACRPDTKLGNKRRKKKSSAPPTFFFPPATRARASTFSTLHNAKVYSFVYIKTNSARPILSVTYCQPAGAANFSLLQRAEANPKK
jgi:hypothetical protein